MTSLLLAGPIVRRVEPRLVSVWVATSEPCTVRLKVWPDQVSAGVGAGVFDKGGAVATGERPTLRVGAGLHVAVVVAEPAPALNPGSRYSYNVTFTGAATNDLRSLGLLADTAAQPAIGYQAGLLPSFATCPVKIEDLVVMQNSCNRMHADGPNLFYVVDELIAASFNDPVHRPHQLFLTGDQTYSDDVAVSVLAQLNRLGRQMIGIFENVTVGGFPIPVDTANLPSGYRSRLVEDEGELTGGGRSHVLGLGERCALHLLTWSPDPWETEDRKAKLDAPATFFTDERHKLPDALKQVPPSLTATRVPAAKAWLSANLSSHSKKGLALAIEESEYQNEQVLAYYSRVGQVRRALANVPTYMMFDDHDVTDDWYLCAQWKHDVLASPLGRSIVRDGLLAYLLMQGWGNDPKAFDEGPRAQLLNEVPRLFPAGAQEGPVQAAVDVIDDLLGTDDSQPRVAWNYAVSGATHQVLVLDTRTRRTFSGPYTPPMALPDGVREDQIPAGPLPSGVEVLFVVVPQPVLDSTLLGEFTQGSLSRGLDASYHIKRMMDHKKQPPPKPGPPLYGLQYADYEGWSSRPDEIDKLLARLSTYRRVLILSGDVHHCESHQLTFWRKGKGLVSEMAQLTCSAVQYSMYFGKIVAATGLQWIDEVVGFGYPIERLVWLNPPVDPVVSPTPPHRALRRRLLLRPVAVPSGGWPAGTTEAIPPDFAWRQQQLKDERPDLDRPEPVQPAPLAADFPAAGDRLNDPDGYAAVAGRHASSLRAFDQSRRMLFWNNVGRITFRREGTRLVVRNQLHSIHPKKEGSPDIYMEIEALFDAPETMPQPTIADAGP